MHCLFTHSPYTAQRLPSAARHHNTANKRKAIFNKNVNAVTRPKSQLEHAIHPCTTRVFTEHARPTKHSATAQNKVRHAACTHFLKPLHLPSVKVHSRFQTWLAMKQSHCHKECAACHPPCMPFLLLPQQSKRHTLHTMCCALAKCPPPQVGTPTQGQQ